MPPKSRKLITTLFFAFFAALPAHAQVTQEQQETITNIQNQIIQRQNQIEKEEVKQRDMQQVAKDREGLEQEELEEFDELEAEAGKVVQNYRRIQCFRIDEILFSKNSLITKEQEKRFTKPYLKRCLITEQISQLSQEITDYLNQQGYITSKAAIPTQSLYSGTLKVNIIESHLEEILFNDEKFFDKTQKFTAFGNYKKGEIFNVKNLEPGMDQINRLPSSNASMKTLPGKLEKNDTIILIENHPKKRTYLNLSYDNFGNSRTGDKRETIGFMRDNLFWLNDNFSIYRTSNNLDEKRKKNGGTSAIISNYSIPFNIYTLNLDYSRSSYYFWSDDDQPIKSQGEVETRKISLDRLIEKNKKTKITASASFTSRDNKNFIDDARVLTSSRQASIFSANFAQSFFMGNTTIFYKPSFHKSLAVMGADSDNKAIGRKAEFDIFRFYGNLTRKFALSGNQFTYNLALDSQISRQKLYAIDQFSVGGIYSVRGFKNGTILGDSGFNIRNELSFGLYQFFPNSRLPLQFFSLSPFYDVGYVKRNSDGRQGRISGTGFRLNFTYKDLRSSLTFSRSISKSHMLLSQYYQDDVAIFFNIGSNLNF